MATGLDAELLAEFATESRAGYAELLSVLGRIVHPRDSEPVEMPPEIWTSVGRLSRSLTDARAMAAPAGGVSARFPLADPGPLGVLDRLLALAAYSGTPAERIEPVGRAVREMSEWATRPLLAAVPSGV